MLQVLDHSYLSTKRVGVWGLGKELIITMMTDIGMPDALLEDALHKW